MALPAPNIDADVLWSFDSNCDIQCHTLPQRFTNPFRYVPHPLCVQAAAQVQAYVAGQPTWQDEWAQGKMLGVLVVQTPDGALQFLAAFSGTLAGTNRQPRFVPPVADVLQPDGVYRRGEALLTSLNAVVQRRQQSPYRQRLAQAAEQAQQHHNAQVEQYRRTIEAAKQHRDALRPYADPTTIALLNDESRFQKAELKRLKRRLNGALQAAQDAINHYDNVTNVLRRQRRQISDAIQQHIFSLFTIINARGERADLNTIFQRYNGQRPPAGAGECCAPKLLQYAFMHGLHPVCMAEFWYGSSPAGGEVRHHHHFYPACRSKCLPILSFMLEGLDVERNDLATPSCDDIRIVYDDPYLSIVVKPAGMLSVPGKLAHDSALTRWQQRFPDATGPLVVHRLDQETSGLILFAKDKDTHKALQTLFERHEVYKQYVAVVEGTVNSKQGRIDLPLRPDPEDRPRQCVDPINGKPCSTEYRVVEHLSDRRTRLLLRPLTGRTHQLRVHCSHPDGLNAPIVGDMLYGNADRRLMLHAQTISFIHPVSHQNVAITVEPDF